MYQELLYDEKTGAVTPAFEITLLNSDYPLSKTIKLEADGSLTAQGHGLSTGYAARITIDGGMCEFGCFLTMLNNRQAFTTGRLRSDLPNRANLITKDKLNGNPSAISRSRDFFVFLQGVAGLLLFDHDRKEMPQSVKDRLEALGGFEEALICLVPEIERTARAFRLSTSAGIRNTKTGEHYPAGGAHLYILIADISDSARALKVLQDWCWLAGLAWITVCKGGALRERSIIDICVGTPEHICYEGAPTLGRYLAQDPRPPQTFEGSPLDSRFHIADLPPEEAAKVEELKEAARAELIPACEAEREAYRVFLKERAIMRGVSDSEAELMASLASFHGFLTGDFLLDFPGKRPVTVDFVLEHLDKYVNRRLPDPIEG